MSAPISSLSSFRKAFRSIMCSLKKYTPPKLITAIADSPAVDHVLAVTSDDPRVVKEVHVTIYHILWELVHVFFEQPGVLAPEVIA